MLQTNRDVRLAISDAGFYLWQVAETLGITDSTFSKKLRREMSADEKEAVLRAVERMKAQREHLAENWEA